MEYNYTEKKIIAVLNGELPAGLAMNALGHLAFATGHSASNEWMGQRTHTDADGTTHAGISKYPFIVLKATPDEIKSLAQKAREKGIMVHDYLQEMFDTGPDEELAAAIPKAKEPTIQYHAIVLLGEAAALKELTGHLKLYR